MNARQLTLDEALPALAADCEPTWLVAHEPSDHTPTPADLRRAELSDLRDQNASLHGLYTATTVPTSHYL